MLAELCHAATKIQASFRGHMARKQGPVAVGGGKGKPEDDLSKELQKLDAKVGSSCWVRVMRCRWRAVAMETPSSAQSFWHCTKTYRTLALAISVFFFFFFIKHIGYTGNA